MVFSKEPKFSMPPFYTMEMMKFASELENAGHKIYHLEVGQPIVPTPKLVVDEAARVLREGQLNYCSALGLLELRNAIAMHYKYTYNINIEAERVVITPGSSLGIYIALLMNFKKGANIAIASPSYPCYRNVIESLGFNPIEIITNREKNYLIMPENLEQYPGDIDGILVASPNNPTGSMYNADELKSLSLFCQNHGILILSDEIYHGITFEEKADTILKFNNDAIVINGFSKYFAMTGWRVGWMIVPKGDVQRYESLLQNIILCTSSLPQYAATKAFLAYQELDAYVEQYKRNRDILYNALFDAGLTHTYKPRGAFYIYVELDHLNLSSMDLCKKLLYEEGVAVAPGMDFSSKLKNCSIRLSFCQNENIIEQASAKLCSFIKKL